MESIKKFLIVLFLCAINAFSQESSLIKKGLLSAQLTLSPSTMFSNNESYFYLHGGFEGFISDKISLAGEGYYYLGNLSTNKSSFNYNHSLFFGASKHFTKNNHDFYIGLQPGISFTKLNPVLSNLTDTHAGTNPLISSVIGYNFYINNLFHFFVQTRLIEGTHNFDVHTNLGELRISAGLGFNLEAL